MAIVCRAATLALVVSTSVASAGCASLLHAGLRAAGAEVDDDRRTPLAGSTAGLPEAPSEAKAPSPADGPPPAVYRHVPVREGYTGSPVAPQSMLYALFRRPGFDAGCQPVPLGLRQVLPTPNGTAAAPLHRWGPLEIGVRGPAAHAWQAGYLEGLRSALPHHLASATDQGVTCGFRSTLYLRLTSRETTPVAVHR